MSRTRSIIGFATTSEDKPGVWIEHIVERPYRGDMVRNSRRLQTTDQRNDSIVISNEMRIVADPYANENFHAIRYVEYLGTKWKVNNVEVAYPRLVLTLGGIYDEAQIASS